MLQKSTHVYAEHGFPLECDVYTKHEAPSGDTPVFLFFHAGGLVEWGRDTIPPWLVQTCLDRDWALISPSYRLMPQVGAAGLLADVSAAYKFAQSWGAKGEKKRRVIVGGASAGFFNAALVVHHCHPPPLALFSICGINTFRHRFFSSSNLLVSEPISHSDMSEYMTGPPIVGVSPPGRLANFDPDMLLENGARNSAYRPPLAPPTATKYHRGMLYEYYTYTNAWMDLVGDIDPGYGGPDKVQLHVAPGQGHLFENESWIEDQGDGMDVVRKAVATLDAIVSKEF